jgi:ABC-type transport system involved in multi-copper enzyme maturation permease subunit
MESKGAKLALLKTEVKRVWGFPVLELAAGFLAFIAVTTIPTLMEIINQSKAQVTFNGVVVDAVYDTMSAQLLPIGLFCGILVALSFAKDYEQGLMQTLLSSPLSRSTVFIVKFVAVTVPLTLLTWGITTFMIAFNYSLGGATVSLLLQVAAASLLTTFLVVFFFGGLATLIALTVKRTIPTALVTMMLGFLMYFVTTLRAETIGSTLANYIAVTPFKASLLGLGKLLGAESILRVGLAENTLETSVPAIGFLAIALVYVLALLTPMYLYYTRRFEVRE